MKCFILILLMSVLRFISDQFELKLLFDAFKRRLDVIVEAAGN